MNNDTTSGKLVVGALGIGNSQDVTLRVLENLQSVDAVVAEDTRQIVKFCRIHSLPIPKLISYREQVHAKAMPGILQLLQANQTLLLLSDRGTPTISDPGYLLVRDVIAAGFEVTTLPGPSAVIAALSISGLPTDRFTFLGFLPRTKGKQIKLMQQAGAFPATLIMYESPYRVQSLLKSIAEAFGAEIKVVLARELTKQFEQVQRGTVSELLAALQHTSARGEYVVLLRPTA